MIEKTQYITDVYSVKPGDYIKLVAGRWAGRWWWILALLFCLLIYLGATVNVAFYYVALMMLFIIIPSLLMFFYFMNMLTYEMRIAILPKKLIIDDIGIAVEFAQLPSDDGPSQTLTLPTKQFIWDEITEVETTGKNMIFYINGGRYKMLPLPYSAITSVDNSQEILELAYSHLDNK